MLTVTAPHQFFASLGLGGFRVSVALGSNGHPGAEREEIIDVPYERMDDAPLPPMTDPSPQPLALTTPRRVFPTARLAHGYVPTAGKRGAATVRYLRFQTGDLLDVEA